MSMFSEHVLGEGHRRKSGLSGQAFLSIGLLHRVTFTLRSLEGSFFKTTLALRFLYKDFRDINVLDAGDGFHIQAVCFPCS